MNLKIKTVEFNVFTRTKSMNCYTDDSNKIYEAAKYLLLNEWESSNKKLKLRLIGVRVSDLKDKQKIQDVASSITNFQANKIDKFFKKLDKKEFTFSNQTNNDSFEEEFINLKQSFNSFCPHCQSYIEGNRDFIEQHIDSCSI